MEEFATIETGLFPPVDFLIELLSIIPVWFWLAIWIAYLILSAIRSVTGRGSDNLWTADEEAAWLRTHGAAAPPPPKLPPVGTRVQVVSDLFPWGTRGTVVGHSQSWIQQQLPADQRRDDLACVKMDRRGEGCFPREDYILDLDS